MYQGIIGVLVLIILIGGAIMIGARKSSPATTMGEEATTSASGEMTESYATSSGEATAKDTSSKSDATSTPSTVASGSDSVSVVDQSAGKAVAVADVSLAKDGWVAIEDNGWVLGAAWFPAGDHKNVTVSLLRATKAGSTYKAVLYYETTGDHNFDLHKDTLVTKADGSALSVAFLAK